MGLSLVIDGVTYPFPEAHEKNWALNVSAWANAVTNALVARLKLAGGTMTGPIVLSGPPTLDLHPATKAYVDASMLGLKVKTECRLASTANVNLASALEDGQTLDGATIATGNRILVKNQSDPRENGIYIAPAVGVASRATDADLYTELFQAVVSVTAGTVGTGTSWVSQTTSAGTIGVDNVSFAKLDFGAVVADGIGIEKSGGTLSLELDGTSLSKSSSGLRIATGGVLNTHIGAGADISRGKMATGASNRLVFNDGAGFLADLAAISASRMLASDASGLPIALALITASRLLASDGSGFPVALAAITASRALVSDSNGFPIHSAVTSAELAFLSGVTLNLSGLLGKFAFEVPADGWRPTTTAGCAAHAQTELVAGQPEVVSLDFDGATAENAFCSVKFPKSWDLGTIEARFFYLVNAAVSTTVKFGVAGVARGDNEALAAAYGTAQFVTDTYHGTGNRLAVTAWTAAITISGTPSEGEDVYLKVSRDPANDTTTQDARLTKVEFRFTANALNDA